MYSPIVIESDGKYERSYDIYSRLLKDRIIFLGSEVTAETANIIIAQLLYLESESQEKDITLYINSPGGDVYAGLAIYDTMNYIKPDVATICIGQAASMGAFLLSAGMKGKRYALSNSRVMIHQPIAGIKGQESDIRIHAEEILKTRAYIEKIFSTNTMQDLNKVNNDMERDYFMTAEQALEYGIIDKILYKRT